MTGRKSYYWDSCVFLTWLNRNSPHEIALRGDFISVIQQILEENEKGRCQIITSQVTFIEALPSGHSAVDDIFLKRLLSRDPNQAYDVDPRVTSKAREIRDFYFKLKQDDPSVRVPNTPDSIHLATAIILKVDEVHTFDTGKKDQFDWIALSGNIAGYNLAISKPVVDQPELSFPPDSEPGSN